MNFFIVLILLTLLLFTLLEPLFSRLSTLYNFPLSLSNEVNITEFASNNLIGSPSSFISIAAQPIDATPKSKPKIYFLLFSKTNPPILYIFQLKNTLKQL